MKGQSMGSISYNKYHNKFVAKFYNTITNIREYIGTFDTEEEAKEKLRLFIFDFYSKHSYLLPKNIALQRNRKFYIYAIIINKKKRHVFCSKYLNEVIDFRLEFIRSLL